MNIKNKDYYFVFCLAGLGSRFKEADYKIPKYLLDYKLNESTIIEEIISSFKFNKATKVKFLCNKRDEKYKNALQSSISKLSLDFDLQYINDTRGQAETAYIATDYIKKNNSEFYSTKPIIFFNGDTILKSRNLEELINIIDEGAHGVIDCFNSSKKNYSYVTVDKDNFITDIKEKIVISNNATSGLYVFSSSKIYSEQYKQMIQNQNNEIYISDIYKNMINNNIKIKANIEDDMTKTIILGTPDEYKNHLNI